MTEQERFALLHLVEDHEGIYIEDNPSFHHNSAKLPISRMLMSVSNGTQVGFDNDFCASILELRNTVCQNHVNDCEHMYQESDTGAWVLDDYCEFEDCH